MTRVGLQDIFFDPNFLLFAYSYLQNRKVLLGIDGVLVKNIILPGIIKMSMELKNNTYKSTPVRRVLFPKSNGKSRLLGISSSTDEVIQQALLLLLEPFFNSVFYKSNHGFRQGFSALICLDEIQKCWQVKVWFL